MASATPQGLGNAAWALVILERQPSASWRTAFLRYASQAAEFATPGSLAQVCFEGSVLIGGGGTDALLGKSLVSSNTDMNQLFFHSPTWPSDCLGYD